MDLKIKRFINIKNILFLFILLIGAFILFKKHKPFIYKILLEEGLPNFSNSYLIRTLIVFITSIILIIGFIYKKQPAFSFLNKNTKGIEKYGALIAISISLFFLFIFLFNTSLFNQLSKEDYPVEWCSALLLFASSYVFAYSSIKKIGYLSTSKITRWSFFLIAIAFFIIAMEEISWFQRVLGFETPEAFNNNIQDEFNLHNFSTDLAENLYYFGAFTLLIIMPFIALIKPGYFKSTYFKLMIPRPFIIVIASIAFSYNFDMWNSVITQTTFFLTVLILFALVYFSKKRDDKIIISFYGIILIIQQIIFLNKPLNYDRGWEITEYKEFFIPLALFIFSLDVFFRLRSLKNNKT